MNKNLLIQSNNFAQGKKYATQVVAQELCKKEKLSVPEIQKKIEYGQFRFTKIFEPLPTFKNDQVEEIQNLCSKKLNFDEKFFIIILQAEKLTRHTGNRLLKLLEEPGNGYNFILTVNNLDELLETIKSRCNQRIILDSDTNNIEVESNIEKKLLDIFSKNLKAEQAEDLNKLIGHDNLSDSQSADIFEKILQQELSSKNKSNARLSTLINFSKAKPNSGNYKLFWKSLFLSMCQ